MNERDWVDWVVIAASVVSSLSLLVSIIIYKQQKNDAIKNEVILTYRKVASYKESIQADKRRLRLLLKNMIILRKRMSKNYVK